MPRSWVYTRFQCQNKIRQRRAVLILISEATSLKTPIHDLWIRGSGGLGGIRNFTHFRRDHRALRPCLRSSLEKRYPIHFALSQGTLALKLWRTCTCTEKGMAPGPSLMILKRAHLFSGFSTTYQNSKAHIVLIKYWLRYYQCYHISGSQHHLPNSLWTFTTTSPKQKNKSGTSLKGKKKSVLRKGNSDHTLHQNPPPYLYLFFPEKEK